MGLGVACYFSIKVYRARSFQSSSSVYPNANIQNASDDQNVSEIPLTASSASSSSSSSSSFEPPSNLNDSIHDEFYFHVNGNLQSIRETDTSPNTEMPYPTIDLSETEDVSHIRFNLHI